MENEIKVGDWIRTAQGTIAQIEEDEFEIKTNIRGQLLYEKWIEGNRYYEVIVKHSFNLIDIIEERRLCKWRNNRPNSK